MISFSAAPRPATFCTLFSEAGGWRSGFRLPGSEKGDSAIIHMIIIIMIIIITIMIINIIMVITRR